MKAKERERLGLPHPATVGREQGRKDRQERPERTRSGRSPFTGAHFADDTPPSSTREFDGERTPRKRSAPASEGLETGRPDRREKLAQQERLAYGRHPVAEALARGDVERLWLEEGIRPDETLRNILKGAEERRIPVQTVSESYLESRIGHNPHQGVLAQVKPFNYAALQDVLDAAIARRDAGDLPGAAILMLDGLEDPGNFGGILRTAAGLGIAGVIIPSRRSVGVTAAVHKTSAGTIGRIPLARVANLRYALEELKEAGWWSVAATSKGDLSPAELPTDVPLVLVMGAEHEGLTPIVEATCDYKVRIPLANRVESLNVGAATAILLAAITLRR
ncbi:MAG TPA: 23S rRNA (guanosine(2251)-2'-O)-methyltransferase RlmB [bacterium]|nr:23S rRNA (guanosine(2251)-2'-O)-methyltransferase RlmB [bacterium]